MAKINNPMNENVDLKLLEEELKSFLSQKEEYNIENGQYLINTLSSNISKILNLYYSKKFLIIPTFFTIGNEEEIQYYFNCSNFGEKEDIIYKIKIYPSQSKLKQEIREKNLLSFEFEGIDYYVFITIICFN